MIVDVIESVNLYCKFTWIYIHCDRENGFMN